MRYVLIPAGGCQLDQILTYKGEGGFRKALTSGASIHFPSPDVSGSGWVRGTFLNPQHFAEGALLSRAKVAMAYAKFVTDSAKNAKRVPGVGGVL